MSYRRRIEVALIAALCLVVPEIVGAQSAARDTSWRRVICVKIAAAMIDTTDVLPRLERQPPDSLYPRSIFLAVDPDASAEQIESALRSEDAVPLATIMQGFVLANFLGPLTGNLDAPARVARLRSAPRVRGAIILSTVERARRTDDSVCQPPAPPVRSR